MTEPIQIDLNARIGNRVRELRIARGLSLEGLAEQCGASRSMISLIERGESSPTAVLLEKVAAGLNVTLASLFESPQTSAEPVARLAQQPPWRDPQSRYVRRNVSPAGFPSPIQIVEISFPPGARVAYETGARDAKIHQQVWVLDGTIDVTVGEKTYRLRSGDCLAMQLNQPLIYHNSTRKTAHYAVVIATENTPRT